LACEDFGRKARKRVPRIAALCAGSANAALRQKDRKAASFYDGREYSITVLETEMNGRKYYYYYFVAFMTGP
jgi:hypothetical protein